MGKKNAKVLIVDDAVFMRRMLSDILKEGGFEIVAEAANGKEGIKKYNETKPDIVTMDIIMPEMGGIEAVKEIIKSDINAKILMVSAMGQQQLVVEAIQAGAKDFIVKPFEPSRVLSAVERLLGA
ncbi:response regulator [Candidatus Poribacteria bacterium]|nr:response regulator [Candidatus Poribacteria bacterium]